MKPYYEHAGITIYHGDCREVLPHLSKADAVITDPPYVIKHVHGGGFAHTRAFYREGALTGLCDFDLTTYGEVLSRASDQLVAFGSRDQVPIYPTWLLAQFGNFDLHIWHKVNAIPFVNNTWKSDLEYIFLGWRSKKHAKASVAEKSKLFQSGIDTENLHPTQKPVSLISKYLRVLAPSTVVDPFVGAGTTLVAAKALGMRAIGIEIEERYCEIAAKRLSQEVLAFGAERGQEGVRTP